MRNNGRRNIADEIKSRCDITDVIGRVVQLKRSGSNYKGLCPFHNEKTPSFVVSSSKQIFTCFGCGASGDVIGFVERYYSLDFRGAVEMLAKEYGISLEGAFSGGSAARDEYYEINRLAARFFFKAMREHANPAYTYMKNRGISEDTMNLFGIGYADESWNGLYDHLKSQGVEETKMMELGLISSSKGKYYDKFRGRVMFPIMNTSGKVIGFGGRIIGDGAPKYLNSQESDVFRKKDNLYALNVSRKNVSDEDMIILVEGYMDAVSLYQAGVRNVAASLGTALTENQARLIKRYTRNVILSYDADSAGQAAAFRGLDILYAEGLRARVLKVTDGKDPDEFIKKNGRKAFLELVERAVPYGDFKIDAIKKKYDMEDPQQRADFINEAAAMLRSMKPVEADIYIKKLAEDAGVSEGAVRAEYMMEDSISPIRTDRKKETDGKETDISLAEQDLLKLMLTDARFTELPEDIKDTVFTEGIAKEIYVGIMDSLDGHGRPDIRSLRESLDEDGIRMLEMIDSKIIPPGREDEIFTDCVDKIRSDVLRKREREVMMALSIAEEEDNGEKIVELTQKLIDIQKKLKV